MVMPAATVRVVPDVSVMLFNCAYASNSPVSKLRNWMNVPLPAKTTLPVPASVWEPSNTSVPVGSLLLSAEMLRPSVAVPLNINPFSTASAPELRSIAPLTVAPSSVPPPPRTVVPAGIVTPRSVPSRASAGPPLRCTVPPVTVPSTTKLPSP